MGVLQYVIVYEQAPACIAAVDITEEVEQLIGEASGLHIDTLPQRGEPILRPGTGAGLVTG